MPNNFGVKIGEWSKSDNDDGKMRIAPIWLSNLTVISKPIIFMANTNVATGSNVGIGWTASETTLPKEEFHVKASSLFEKNIVINSSLSVANEFTVANATVTGNLTVNNSLIVKGENTFISYGAVSANTLSVAQTVTISNNLSISGSVKAATLVGDGSGLTSIPSTSFTTHAEIVGSALLSSSGGGYDTASGGIYIMYDQVVSSDFDGFTVSKFRAYMNANKYLTPLVLLKEGSNGTTKYTVKGIGTSRSVGSSGINEFDFGLQVGTATLQTNYTFAFTDRQLVWDTGSSSFTTNNSNTGAVYHRNVSNDYNFVFTGSVNVSEWSTALANGAGGIGATIGEVSGVDVNTYGSPDLTREYSIYFTITGNPNLIVKGTMSIGSIVTFLKSLSVGSNLIVSNKTILDSKLSVGNSTILSSDLSVANKVVLSSDLSTAGEVVLGSHLSVAKKVILSSDLSTAGEAVLGSHLSVAKKVILSSDLSTSGEVVLGSTLSVSNKIFSSDVHIYKANSDGAFITIESDGGSGSNQPSSGIIFKSNDGNPSNPSSSENTYKSGQIDSGWVNGESAWNQSVIKLQTYHTNAETLSDTLTLKGASIIANSTISVSESVIISKILSVAQTVKASPVSTGVANYGHFGQCALTNYYTNYAAFHHASTGSNAYAILQASNGETFLNAATGTNINFRINNSGVIVLNSTVLSIGISTKMSQSLSVAGEAVFGSHLSVAKKMILSSDLSVANKVILSSDLSVAKKVILSSDLSAAGEVILGSHLSVGKKVILSSNISIGDSAVLSSDLSTAGEVILGSHLSVAKKVILSSDLSAAGEVVLGSHLSVAKKVILSSDLSTGGKAIFSDLLSVGSDLTVSGNLVVIGQTTNVKVQSETIEIGDNMIQLNANTTSSSGYVPDVDFGFFGQTTIGGIVQYAGLGYDKSANAIITFRNSNLPTNSISDLGMNLIVSGNTVIKDTLSVSGSTKLAGLTTTGATTLNSTLSVAGSKNVIGNSHLGEWHTFGSNYARFWAFINNSSKW